MINCAELLIFFILSLTVFSAQVVVLVSTYNNQENKDCTVEVISPASHIVERGGTLFILACVMDMII